VKNWKLQEDIMIFFYLHKKLLDKYKSLVIPPIPEKDWQTTFSSQNSSKFSKEFIQFRKRQLNNFLQCIASHPKLRDSQEFKDFFISSAKEEKSTKTLGSYFSNVFGGAKSTVSNITTTFSNIEDPNPWFNEKAKLLDAFSEKLQAMSTLTNALCNNMFVISTLYTNLAKPSQDVSTLAFQENSFCQDFASLSHTFAEIPPAMNPTIAKQAIHFRDVLNYYLRYVANAKLVLQNRLVVLTQYQAAEKNYEAKKNSTNRAEVSKLEVLFGDAKSAYEQFSEEAKAELIDLEKQYTRVLRQAISNLAISNLNMHSQAGNHWKTLLSKITY